MDKIEQNPDDIIEYARILEKFNDRIKMQNSIMQYRLIKLGDTWKDSHFVDFAELFKKNSRIIDTFCEENNDLIPKLLLIAERAKNLYD